jgi:hypothetical protein
LLLRLLIALALLPGLSWAERATTRDAFDRLEEVLELRQDDGLLDARDVLPIVLVSTQPRYEASASGFTVQALMTLTRVFGAGSVRMCEACMRPRTEASDGRLKQSSGPISLDEVVALDDRYRGDTPRAKTAIWIDETARGVSVRIVDLRSARVVFAQNVDPMLEEYEGGARSFRLAAELERRNRGESLTHAIFDLGLYPGQHVSMEWDDQFGENNTHLAGVVLSFYDPVFGIGASYHHALDWANMLVGGQLVLSIPTIVAESLADGDADLIDPTLTLVGMLRVPFGNSNYAGLLTVSTNGEVGLGISLLNTSFIPVIP